MAARILLAMLVMCCGTSVLRATECETAIARHMIGQALLAAHLVALVEKARMAPSEINAILKSISERPAQQEFWITDSKGHAYLTNTGVDFTLSPNSSKQPQASAFWSLITSSQEIVVQGARKREIDNQILKYVGVDGVDKARIFRVGVGAVNLCK
jgi:hypothetical protein